MTHKVIFIVRLAFLLPVSYALLLLLSIKNIVLDSDYSIRHLIESEWKKYQSNL